jgi:hypothetical protein
MATASVPACPAALPRASHQHCPSQRSANAGASQKVAAHANATTAANTVAALAQTGTGIGCKRHQESMEAQALPANSSTAARQMP